VPATGPLSWSCQSLWFCVTFCFLNWGTVRHLTLHKIWRTTPCWPFTTVYSVYSQLPSIPGGCGNRLRNISAWLPVQEFYMDRLWSHTIYIRSCVYSAFSSHESTFSILNPACQFGNNYILRGCPACPHIQRIFMIFLSLDEQYNYHLKYSVTLPTTLSSVCRI
jgi:hypothetical protein